MDVLGLLFSVLIILILLVTPELSKECMTGLRLGLPSAWEELYDRYSSALYGIILQHVSAPQAAGVLENAFIRLYREMHRYRSEEERLFTWMYRLTLAVCADAKAV